MDLLNRKYPLTRMRRNRMKSFSRNLMAENRISINDLIWPVFIKEGTNKTESIKTMPDIFCFSIDSLISELEKPVSKGLNAIALFPQIDAELKNNKGTLALDENNLVCRAIKTIKSYYPDLGLICDVALDPFTDHGHDGIVKNGAVRNDETIEILINQALVYANSGCDVLAPSDMMDGRIKIIRENLEKNGFHDIILISYAAKYASSFYGPFRDAVKSSKLVEPINKKSYQMDIANVNEAIQEISLDISEGADMIMIKPGMPYLDIISKAKQKFGVPTLAYQVSGEYSMIMSASKANYLSFENVLMESLTCFKRAGADGIFTYFVPKIIDIIE